jgi:hypothetical protein
MGDCRGGRESELPQMTQMNPDGFGFMDVVVMRGRMDD